MIIKITWRIIATRLAKTQHKTRGDSAGKYLRSSEKSMNFWLHPNFSRGPVITSPAVNKSCVKSLFYLQHQDILLNNARYRVFKEMCMKTPITPYSYNPAGPPDVISQPLTPASGVFINLHWERGPFFNHDCHYFVFSALTIVPFVANSLQFFCSVNTAYFLLLW